MLSASEVAVFAGTSAPADPTLLDALRGFHHVGVYKDVGFKFDRWLDIVHMQREL